MARLGSNLALSDPLRVVGPAEKTVIIDCGKRRLVSNRYGWKIEIQHFNKETGLAEWKEDRPAWPASLAKACEALCERELSDTGDITLDQLPDALKHAAHEVRRYMAIARRAA